MEKEAQEKTIWQEWIEEISDFLEEGFGDGIPIKLRRVLPQLIAGKIRELGYRKLESLKIQIEQMENPIRDIYPVDKVTDIIRAKARGYDEAIQDILGKLQ